MIHLSTSPMKRVVTFAIASIGLAAPISAQPSQNVATPRTAGGSNGDNAYGTIDTGSRDVITFRAKADGTKLKVKNISNGADAKVKLDSKIKQVEVKEPYVFALTQNCLYAFIINFGGGGVPIITQLSVFCFPDGTAPNEFRILPCDGGGRGIPCQQTDMLLVGSGGIDMFEFNSPTDTHHLFPRGHYTLPSGESPIGGIDGLRELSPQILEFIASQGNGIRTGTVDISQDPVDFHLDTSVVTGTQTLTAPEVGPAFDLGATWTNDFLNPVIHIFSIDSQNSVTFVGSAPDDATCFGSTFMTVGEPPNLSTILVGARGSEDLSVFDVTDPTMPAPLPIIDVPRALSLDALGDRLSVSGATTGGADYDMSDPEHPVLVEQYAGDTANCSLRIGDLLFVGNKYTGLQVYQEDGSDDLTRIGNLSGVFINRLDVFDSTHLISVGSGVRIIDISTPTAPTVSASHPHSFLDSASPLGNGLYFLSGGFSDNRLEIMDFSNLSMITRRVGLTPTYSTGPSIVFGTKAFVCNGSGSGDRYRIYELGAAFDQIVEVGSFTPPPMGAFGGFASDIDLEGNMIAIAESGNGAFLYDISTPLSPVMIGHSPLVANNISLEGNRLLIGTNVLNILDISTPSIPQLIARIGGGDRFLTYGDGCRSSILDGIIHFAAEDAGLLMTNYQLPEFEIILERLQGLSDSPVNCDVNMDGVVDMADYTLWRRLSGG